MIYERIPTEYGKTEKQSQQPVRPITNYTGNPVNQSKLETDTCSSRETRENLCELGLFLIGY